MERVRPRIAELDGLRGVAALVVLLNHVLVSLYRIESEIDKAIASGTHTLPATPAAPVDPDTLFDDK